MKCLKTIYDDRYHLHLGYYENGFDIEAIAFKRKSQGIWDIFFDFEQYGLKAPVPATKLKGFGVRIFSIDVEEFDYNDVAKRFEQWLLNHRIIS